MAEQASPREKRCLLQLQMGQTNAGEWAQHLINSGTQRLPVGPILQLIPGTFYPYISQKTLKSYLAPDEETSRELERKIFPADIPVIVKPYTESVYKQLMISCGIQVAESLNDLGNLAMETIHPWILNVLIDWDHFDTIICSNPKTALITDKGQPGAEESEVTKGTEVEKQTTWTRPAVLSLISLHQKYEEQFRKPGVKNKAIWSMISKEINAEHELQVPFSDKQCEQKWKNITKAFRDTVDHNSKSGNNPKKCPYFMELQDSYGYRPNVTPVYVAGSSKGTDTEDSSEPTPEPSVKKPKRQNRKDHVVEILEEIRQDIKSEQASLMATLAKQHEDRMQNEKVKLNLFEKLVNSVSKAGEKDE